MLFQSCTSRKYIAYIWRKPCMALVVLEQDGLLIRRQNHCYSPCRMKSVASVISIYSGLSKRDGECWRETHLRKNGGDCWPVLTMRYAIRYQIRKFHLKWTPVFAVTRCDLWTSKNHLEELGNIFRSKSSDLSYLSWTRLLSVAIATLRADQNLSGDSKAARDVDVAMLFVHRAGCALCHETCKTSIY